MESSPQDTENQYEEVEVEVTDDEGADEDPLLETPSKPVGTLASPVNTTPGKVVPSKEVKEMKMTRTPETQSGSLPAGKNPFPSFGSWTPKTINQIDIEVPILTGKCETTNDLTRGSKPEARYWKAPLIFKHGNFTSSTLRFDNVPIPYHTGQNYGTGFVYMCLPSFVGEKFAEACKTRRPTRVTERSLVADNQRWWKVANNVADVFGIINGQTKKFQKKSLATIFDSTNSGITATVVASFFLKASTDDREPLKSTTTGTVSVEISRAFITGTDVNVQMPTRVSYKKVKVEPTATSKDVASDDLMKRMGELGL